MRNSILALQTIVHRCVRCLPIVLGTSLLAGAAVAEPKVRIEAARVDIASSALTLDTSDGKQSAVSDLHPSAHVGPPLDFGDALAGFIGQDGPEYETKEIAPSGGTVSSQAAALPSGASTLTGLGESFSPHLSTGIATYGVPIRLSVARGGVQPRLDLSYTSGGGFSVAGHGWSIGSSAISRQTDRGLPGYDDRTAWHPGQDRFVFGGMELVPICVVAGGECDGALDDEVMPSWANGWQYFRARVVWAGCGGNQER